MFSIPAEEELTWYLGGSLPETLQQAQAGELRPGFPITLALVLEEENLPLAEEIGQTLLMEIIGSK
jgi:hypothetical protein